MISYTFMKYMIDICKEEGHLMSFCHEIHYGRDCFYPLDVKAKKFVEAFPHSSGKRKSLTIEQINILNDLGVPLIIKEKNLIFLQPLKE